MGICLRQPVREQEGLLETPGSGTGKDTRFPVLSENTQSHEHSDLLLGPRKMPNSVVLKPSGIFTVSWLP